MYKFNKRTGQYEVDTRDFNLIKKKFLFQLTNFGQPIISVVDANHNNRGELLLAHLFEGVEMQPGLYAGNYEKLVRNLGPPGGCGHRSGWRSEDCHFRWHGIQASEP